VKPAAMGIVMGLMLPFALHGNGVAGGIVFLAAHGLVVAVVFWAATRFAAVRTAIAQHRPSRKHFFHMSGGIAAGWAVVCIACPLVFGMQHPWT